MKYMVISTVKDGVAIEKAMEAWGNEKPQKGVGRLDAWHVGAGTGKSFNLYEVDNLLSLTAFLMQYQDLLDTDSYAVVDDAEAKKYFSV